MVLLLYLTCCRCPCPYDVWQKATVAELQAELAVVQARANALALIKWETVESLTDAEAARAQVWKL